MGLENSAKLVLLKEKQKEMEQERERLLATRSSVDESLTVSEKVRMLNEMQSKLDDIEARLAAVKKMIAGGTPP